MGCEGEVLPSAVLGRSDDAALAFFMLRVAEEEFPNGRVNASAWLRWRNFRLRMLRRDLGFGSLSWISTRGEGWSSNCFGSEGGGSMGACCSWILVLKLCARVARSRRTGLLGLVRFMLLWGDWRGVIARAAVCVPTVFITGAVLGR